MRENARAKADRILIEGRIVITSVRPGEVTASVRGEGHVYTTGWRRGTGWHCTCEARRDCSHRPRRQASRRRRPRGEAMTDPDRDGLVQDVLAAQIELDAWDAAVAYIAPFRAAHPDMSLNELLETMTEHEKAEFLPLAVAVGWVEFIPPKEQP